MKKISLFALFPLILGALPSDPVCVQGSFDLEMINSSTQQINVEDRSILDWESFSIGLGETATFNLPDFSSVILNRVTGRESSEILGNLLSNGQVYLINPHGILIGKDAVIDVHSFLASTLDVSNEHFLANEELHFVGTKSGSIVNLGQISSKGDVYLFSHTIENQGVIQTPEEVHMACALEVLFQPTEKKIFIRPSESEQKAFLGMKHSGKTEGHTIELAADGNLYEYAIQLEGEVDALTVSEENGKIFLRASDGVNWVGGSLNAPGGKIHVLGDENLIMENASLNTSSDFEGGEILIGGDVHGKNPSIPNGSLSYIHEKALVNADALENGDGGKIVVWGDKVTGFYGKASARGGLNGGDGGFVEVSSKDLFDFKGRVDRLAPKGKPGTLLLDPTDITFVSAGATTNLVLVPATPVPGTSTYQASPNTSSSATLLDTDFDANLMLGNIVVTTTSNGAGNGDIIIPVSLGGGIGFNSMTFNADRDIITGPNITIRTDFDITFNAGRDMSVTRTTIRSDMQSLFFNIGRNMTVVSSDLLALSGSSIMDFNLQGDFFFGPSANVFSSGIINANSRNFFVTDSLFSGNGTITINASQDVSFIAAADNVQSDCLADWFVTCNNFLASGVTPETIEFDCRGIFQIIANEDITILDNVRIGITTGPPSDLILVVDNAFPSYPFFGMGALTIDNPNGTINVNGPVRFFTSQRILNSIGMSTDINGGFFSPGPFNVDSATEQWNTYFFDSFGGIPFTVFYKEPDVFRPAVLNLQEDPIVANVEMLRDLHPYDEWILWYIRFEELFSDGAVQPFALPRRYRAYSHIPLLPDKE